MPFWHPDGQCFMAPLRRVAFTENMMFSAAWAVHNKTSLRRQRHAFTQIPQGMKRRVTAFAEQLKMSVLPHQHHLGDINVDLVITIIYSIKWQGRLW